MPAIPHYLVLAILFGGGTWLIWESGTAELAWSGSVVGLLMLFAGVLLAITGSYFWSQSSSFISSCAMPFSHIFARTGESPDAANFVVPNR